jgi:hypothetical protein
MLTYKYMPNQAAGGTEMARRVEVGAGVAAAALSLVALAVVLLAPIAPICRVPLTASGRCPVAVRFVNLLHVSLPAGVWVYIFAMVIVPLAGAAGAVLDGELGQRRGVLLLWGGAVLAFAGCAMSALSLGLFYLPAVLALLIAGYAAVLRRLRGAPVPTAG